VPPLDPLECAARLDAAAARLADALAAVTIGPAEWVGDAAIRFHTELAQHRVQLGFAATGLRRLAATVRAGVADVGVVVVRPPVVSR
jgi:hypothetical protein